MKLTEDKLRKIIQEEITSLIKEGVQGYEIGPDLDDFDGMDFNGASAAIPWDEVYDEDGFENVLKYVSKYKSKIKKFGIKSDKDMENFAKWMSSGMHKKS